MAAVTLTVSFSLLLILLGKYHVIPELEFLLPLVTGALDQFAQRTLVTPITVSLAVSADAAITIHLSQGGRNIRN